MTSDLNNFFKEERKRVFEPGPYFSHRVMAHLKQERQEQAGSQALRDSLTRDGLWDTVLGATRPVVALGLTLLLALVGIHMFVPVEPARGLIDAYLDSEVSVAESFLYTDADVPPSHEVLEQLMVLEAGQ